MGNDRFEAFVQGRAQEIAEQINEETIERTPRLVEGTDVVERAGQVKTARFHARAAVLHEMVYGMPKEPGTEDKEMPRVSLPPLDG